MDIDIWLVIKWWIALFLMGAVSFPLTKKLFASWYDRGYMFAKAIGMAFVTYIVYISAMAHVLPFSFESVGMSMITVFFFGLLLHILQRNASHNASTHKHVSLFKSPKQFIHHNSDRLRLVGLIVIEEVFFFSMLLLWSWVKGHEPSIHGLEKFMDFGFMQSILNSRYFPAPDMWYAGYPINYYYFGHTVVAVLTKFSNISLVYTFNLMLATLFALCVTQSFAIGVHVLQKGLPKLRLHMVICGALLISFLVSLGGNMQTLYAFTKGYTGENVQPFWQLLWPVSEFTQKLPEGLERYWYANATRFIPYTIHEFPSYSFVVSDVHGHVMSIPFVLLALALLLCIFLPDGKPHEAHTPSTTDTQSLRYVLYGLLVSILLMTNALDGPIYLGLFIVLYGIFNWKYILSIKKHWYHVTLTAGATCMAAVLGSIPFMSRFSSFVSGLAINCPPAFLANQKIGPLVFEEIEKCQHSPVWMMWILWGFFIYCGVFLFAWYMRGIHKKEHWYANPLMLIFAGFFVVSLGLIIFPEFFYFKDIYPQHFRSNTMFKLGYQAFIMFAIISGYTIISAIEAIHIKLSSNKRLILRLFFILLIPQLFLVSIYPIFSVRSYFDSLRTYKGLDGMAWLADAYPDDYAGIQWLKSELRLGEYPESQLPVIIEADGDSYTDHARYSAFTGLPAVIGWPVHEWLWRGTYDVVAPRREEVRVVYESENYEETQAVIKKYGVKYIIVGGMEREKFKQLNLQKLEDIARPVFTSGDLIIYGVSE